MFAFDPQAGAGDMPAGRVEAYQRTGLTLDQARVTANRDMATIQAGRTASAAREIADEQAKVALDVAQLGNNRALEDSLARQVELKQRVAFYYEQTKNLAEATRLAEADQAKIDAARQRVRDQWFADDAQDRTLRLAQARGDSEESIRQLQREIDIRERARDLPCKPRLRRYGPGDLLIIDIPEAGLVEQPAVVLRRSLNPETMGVSLILRGETLEKHAFALAATGQAPPTPALKSTEEIDATLSSTNLIDWSQVRDPDGTKPEDGATVGGTIGENIKNSAGEIVPSGELLNSALTLNPDGSLVAKIGSTERVLGKLKLPDMNAASDASRRQLENDLASLAAAVAQLATGQAIVQNVFRDAGLYTDPESGVAKLFAIESRAEQITKLSVTLNAALASINLKASVNYVNEAILSAQLGGSSADLTSLLVRLTSAETNISGLQASIQLKADATIVTGLQGSVTSIQQSIDAINAVIEQKASRTVVDGIGARLTLAEQTLSSLDAATITSAVSASRRAPGDSDAAAANDILAALAGWDASKLALTAVASAKMELTAKTDSNRDALASLSTQLGVQVGAVSALVSTEQAARIAGDSATASDLSAYKASTNSALAQVNGAITAQTSNLEALSGQFTTFRASIGDFGQVTVSQAFSALADRTGRLEGRYTLAIDTNGRLQGFVLAGSQNGPASFSFIDTDLRMGTGRIVFNNGTYMRVQGTGFGASNEFISWFGPTMAITSCTRANAISYEAINGDAYFGGSLSAGTFRNSSASSSLAPDASIIVGPFQSNGKPRSLVVSLDYMGNRRITTACPNPAPAVPVFTLEIYRGADATGVLLASQTLTGRYECSPGAGEFEPGYQNDSVNASFTLSDPLAGNSFTYFARIRKRSINVEPVRQILTVISTEQ
ncbi:hypothetical protein [Sphingomonas sp. 2378]|uniref:hypothetical protein n=1 Tax=Sphingomonas sp. 2378 TaxID=1219748 RepID=UPI00311ADA15